MTAAGATSVTPSLFPIAVGEHTVAGGNFTKAKELRAANPDLTSDAFKTLSTEELYAKANPSVVRITSSTADAKSLGSGFFFRRGGYILTNHHVVAEAGSVIVSTADERKFSAEVVASSATPDMAVLKIDLAEHDTIKLGHGRDVKPGMRAMLIGFPIRDLPTSTLNVGVISNTDRSYEGQSVYQLDISANHGNSGGPVLDYRGRLVGILTFGFGDFDVDRFNFAIQIDEVRSWLQRNLGADLVPD